MSNKRHVAEALTAAEKKVLAKAQRLGNHGDDKLIHANRLEEAVLRKRGGVGTVNPKTGLRQFYEDAGGSGRAGNVGQGGHNDLGGGNRGGNGGEGGGGANAGKNGSAPTGGYAGTRNPNGSLANGANTNAASNHSSNVSGGNKSTAGNENAAQGESIASGSSADINGYGDGARVNSSNGKAGPVLSGEDFKSWTSAPTTQNTPSVTISRMAPGTFDSQIDNPGANETPGYISGHAPSDLQNLAREALGWAGVGYAPNSVGTMNPDGTTNVQSRVSVDPLGAALTAASFASPVASALSLGYKAFSALTGIHAPNVGFNIGGTDQVDPTTGQPLGASGFGSGGNDDSTTTTSLIRKLVTPTVVTDAPTGGTIFNSAGVIRKPGTITNYLANALNP